MTIDGLVQSYIVAQQSYKHDTVIIKENDKGGWVFVVLEGRVKVKKNTPKGFVTFFTLKQGDVFGEIGLFGKRKGIRATTVVADGPVQIGLLDKERLEREFQALSPQLKGLITTLISNLGRAINDVSLLAAG
jgi:CRP-like cAMP-binding protein